MTQDLESHHNLTATTAPVPVKGKISLVSEWGIEARNYMK